MSNRHFTLMVFGPLRTSLVSMVYYHGPKIPTTIDSFLVLDLICVFLPVARAYVYITDYPNHDFLF